MKTAQMLLESALSNWPNTKAELEIANLKNDINNYDSELQALNIALKALEQNKDIAENEYTIEKESVDSLLTTMRENISSFKKRNEIIKVYMETMEITGDHNIYKILREVETFNVDLHQRLKPIHEEAKDIRRELMDLKELNNKRSELEIKTRELVES